MPFFRDEDTGVECVCGLVQVIPGEYQSYKHPVPLKGVKISADVIDFVAEVVVEQEYVNKEEK